MKILTLLGVMVALCLFVQGQLTKPLSVGDRVPDITFTHVINGNQKKVNLYSFKNKNVIIDLWNRHCLACIAAFPKVERYQKKYEEQLQFILANPHDAGYEKEVNALLKGIKERTGFYPSLPIALNDTLLNYYFPHSGVPHYIWINNKQQVAAITGLEEVTEKNIERFVKGEKLHLAVKDAAEFKSDLLALIRKGEIKDDDLISYSFFSGYQPYTNLKTGYVKNENNSIISYHIINKPLSFIISNAFYTEINDLPANRVFNYPANKDSIYCYQLKLSRPIITTSELAEHILADLQRTFHITGALKKQQMECLVIKEIKNINTLRSKYSNAGVRFSKQEKGAMYMHHMPLSDAIRFLDNLPTPLLNETDCAQEIVDFEFPNGFDPGKEDVLMSWFQSNGFVIQKENRLLDVFEFSSTL